MDDPRPASPTDAPRVLVVEDSTINQALARCHLQRLGCTVDVAVTGYEAVEAARRTRYDLILMDYRLPRLDGCAATRILRRLERSQNRPPVPILGLTASLEPGIQQRCVQAGMDRCYRKPLNETILREIRQWLDEAPETASALQVVMRQEPSGSVPARARCSASGFR
jgi:CheY-like chemotaxis protein